MFTKIKLMRNLIFTRFSAFIVLLFIILVPGSFTLPRQHNFLGHDDKGGLLNDILRRGKLVAITDNNPLNYFTYKGEPKGYQYDMLQSFATHLGVELELISEPDPHKAMLYLKQRQVDIIAMELPATIPQRNYISFADPLFVSKQVLVQRKPEGWRRMPDSKTVESKLVRNLSNLSGKTIEIPLQNQKQYYLADIQHSTLNTANLTAISDVSQVEMIEAVAAGEIEYTLAYEHIAKALSSVYNDIDVNTPTSPDMEISWAVRKGAVNLLNEINQWIGSKKDSREFASLYDRYYSNPRWASLALGHKLNYSGISDYDELIKNSLNSSHWDWRLVSALIYKESRFRADVVSHRGAFGLMQLMPHTARRFGADINSSPAEQIAAGVKLIQHLDKMFQKSVPDPAERVKFVLAAYNIGQAHIIDAQKLAAKHGKNPHVWYDNVEYYLLAKSKPEFYNDPVVKHGKVKGVETQRFVRDVLDKYEHYKTLAAK